MPSVRPSRSPRKGCLFAAAGVSTFFVVFFLLLATGGLEGLIRSIVHRLTAGEEAQVTVYGGASDLFRSTGVDSVIVTNDRGLRVAVYGARVTGSVLAFLMDRKVDDVHVDSLIIISTPPSSEPPDSSLTPVFAGTMAGMVTRADNVYLQYGRVEDYLGTVLVDSMYLDASIPDIEDVTVNVRNSSVSIPLFGHIAVSGVLEIDSTRTTLTGFSAQCPPGTFDISGYLNADSTLELQFQGTASSAFMPELPFITASVEGIVIGSIPAPSATISVSQGCLNYDGLLIGITLDTLAATRDSCSVINLKARTGGVAADVSGTFGFHDLNWSGSVFVSLQNTNLSAYFPELPETDLTGTLSIAGNGFSGNLGYLDMRSSFSESHVLEYPVSQLNLECRGNSSGLEGELNADLVQGSIQSVFSASLGLDYMPVAWKADLKASVPRCGVIAPFIHPILENADGLLADVSGEGNQSAFSVDGSVTLASFQSDTLGVRNAGFSGAISSGTSGISVSGVVAVGSFSLFDAVADASASGLEASLDLNLSPDASITASGVVSLESFLLIDSLAPASISGLDAVLDLNLRETESAAVCTLSMQQVSYDDLIADSLLFQGELGVNQLGPGGFGSIQSSSILIGDTQYSFSTTFAGEPGMVHLENITIGAPGNLDLSFSGLLNYSPDSLGFSLGGIALTRAGKLRLISSGDIELSTDSSGVHLDTLWLDLPSGEIAADGWLRGDSVEVVADLSNVDIASFTSMLGISVPLSGILEAQCLLAGKLGDVTTKLSILIDHPTYNEWDQSDSLTVDISSSGDSLIVHGLWSWTDGIRSGLRVGMDGIWDSNSRLDIKAPDIIWLEAELTGVGDELFYLLPMPFKTSGASVSARIEYQRDTADFSAGIASHFNRIYLTNPGIEFPGATVYFTYPDPSPDGQYNGTLTLNSGEGQESSLQASVLLDVDEDLTFARGSLPIELKGYSFQADFNQWQTLIAGVGWMQLSGSLFSNSDNITEKPRITGKLEIDQATISMGGGGTIEGSGSSSSAEPEELPIDLNIRISGDRGIWFRNNYANVELSTSVDITTVRGQLAVGGEVKAVRGGVYLLGREFQITQGDIRILQTTPLGIELDIQAEARVRSTVSGAEYIITVTVTGDPENPEITLTGTGPAGAVSEQDIVSLLTAGMTYGELQQFDSTALGSVAGNYLGQWLARSIRDDVGLDALQFTPDFSSDTTSLVVNAGKYVLPDLFVSFSSDVFSSDAGTIRAQYFINRDFFLEGSTKSTLTGSHDPSLELHYTFRY